MKDFILLKIKNKMGKFVMVRSNLVIGKRKVSISYLLSNDQNMENI